MKTSKLFFAVVLFTLFGTATHAAIPQRIPYQGRLTDPGGVPVADGAHLVKFTIYDAAGGGTDLWNSGFQSVTTVTGLFSYELGSSVALPDGLFADSSRYLGITYNTDPEMVPRVKLNSQAYAYHALSADSADHATLATSAVSAGNADLLDGINSTGFSQTGHKHLPSNIDPQGAGSGLDADLLDGLHASEIVGSHVHDSDYVNIGGDVMTGPLGFSNGSSAMMYIYQSGTTNPARPIVAHSPGFPNWGLMYNDLVDEFIITGAGDTNFVVKPFGSGDDAVRLGVGAIGAAEVLDEPGVAQNSKTFATSVSAIYPSVRIMLQRTINCPTAGYVMVSASFDLSIFHLTGFESGFIFGVSSNSTAFIPSHTAHDWKIGSTKSSGLHEQAFSVQNIFTVSAGNKTFYLLMRRNSTSAPFLTVDDYNLSLVFFPTAYGTVGSTRAQSTEPPDAVGNLIDGNR